MKTIYFTFLIVLLFSCTKQTDEVSENPFFVGLNVPVDYAKVTADDIEEYANITIKNALKEMEKIRQNKVPTFENTFTALDDIYNKVYKASNNCFMLYWVSPDSLSRVKGLAGYQLLDSISTNMYSDHVIYTKMLDFTYTDAYTQLTGHRKILVDDLILDFKQSGVNLDDEDLVKFKKLTKEIKQLSSAYSDNMNASAEVLVLDEPGAAGLPENFKTTFKTGDLGYEIPIINATRDPVLKNASNEATRKAYYMKFYNRASDENLVILDSLVSKRYALAHVMNHDSYAAYYLVTKMAKNPATVWAFINDLVDRASEKAKTDIQLLIDTKKQETGSKNDNNLPAWDVAYYNNQVLKNEWQVDHEKIREYLPMDQCLKGVFDIYQKLLGLEFRKVENPSVWYEEVTMYEVYEGDSLRGRFYLDLFPRPNKESWFYGVQISSGKATKQGYEVPCSLLLGNFTRPTETLPSLVSFSELNTLFHEFGHIVDGMSYHGEFALQADAKSDFVESMSQIFENWIWDYDMLSSFAKQYKTGEVLSKKTFDNMLNAKNVSSGYYAIASLRNCIYDLNLYDKYNPASGLDSDDLWREIDAALDLMPMYVEGTHPQASWIHINTHPVYYYGYLWSKVYAQDMFTEFEKNGLLDQETGLRYRQLILANGKQRDAIEAVEEFLGRPSNNEAYIKSLGLN